VYASANGLIDIGLSPPEESASEDTPVAAQIDNEPEAAGRKKRRGKSGARKGPRYSGNSTTGDDLGGPEMRDLQAANAGGEEQLLGTEIERGFDGAFPQIRRCFMLAMTDEPITGKLVFGLRISGASGVTKVNLAGPSMMTQGEAGDCLRKAARGISFRRFNGPDMLVHYPVTLQ